MAKLGLEKNNVIFPLKSIKTNHFALVNTSLIDNEHCQSITGAIGNLYEGEDRKSNHEINREVPVEIMRYSPSLPMENDGDSVGTDDEVVDASHERDRKISVTTSLPTERTVDTGDTFTNANHRKNQKPFAATSHFHPSLLSKSEGIDRSIGDTTNTFINADHKEEQKISHFGPSLLTKDVAGSIDSMDLIYYSDINNFKLVIHRVVEDTNKLQFCTGYYDFDYLSAIDLKLDSDFKEKMLDSLQLVLIVELHKSTPFVFSPDVRDDDYRYYQNKLSTDIIIGRLDVQYCGVLRDSLSKFIRSREERYYQICRWNQLKNLYPVPQCFERFNDTNGNTNWLQNTIHQIHANVSRDQSSRPKLSCNYDVNNYSTDMISNSQTSNTVDSDQQIKVIDLGIVQEGLPNWIVYVPIAIYSRKCRQFLQFIILLYTLFSVIWATWQLYRNVHFIKASLQPVVMAISYYSDRTIILIDRTLLKFTHYWLKCFKPLCILFTTTIPMSTIYKLVEQLLFTILIDDTMTETFVKLYRLFQWMSKLCMESASGVTFLLKTLRVKYLLGLLFKMILNIWNNINSASIPMLTVKEQLALIRTLTVNHIRSLFFGIVTIIRYVFDWRKYGRYKVVSYNISKSK